MFKLFSTSVFFFFILSQEFPEHIFATMIFKSVKYNKSSNGIFYVVQNNKEKYAQNVNSVLIKLGSNSTLLSMTQAAKVQSKSNVIFINMTNDSIQKFRNHSSEVFTSFSNQIENIQFVSLVYILGENKKPRIHINSGLVKKEASFSSNFLRLGIIH